MRRISGLRDLLTPRIVPFARVPIPRVPSPTELCAVCLQKVTRDDWSPEPVPTCRSCWPLLAWFRGLYADSEAAEILGRLNPETRFIEDISVDSLDYIEFLMEAERAFDITIPDQDAERLATVGDFLRYIRGCLRDNQGKLDRPIPDDGGKLWDRDLDG